MAIAVIALVAVGVRLVDTPAARAVIQSRLAAALGGQIAWEGLELRLLPAPHGELRRVRIEIPGALAVRADQVDVYLRLWPLLRGQPEIASLSLARPEIRIDAVGGAKQGEAPDPLAVYRQVMAATAHALQTFAPDTAVRVEAASIVLAAPALELRELDVKARTGHDGVELEIAAASNLWKRARVEAHVGYADLSARALVTVEELALPQLPWKLSVKQAELALAGEELTLSGGQGALGESTFAGLEARLALGAPLRLTAASGRASVALGQWFPWLRERLPLDALDAVSGRVEVTLKRMTLPFDRPAAVDFEVLVAPREVSATLKALPGPISATGGTVGVERSRVRLDRLAVGLLDAKAEVSGAYALGEGSVEAAIGQGAAGERLVRWALERAGAPAGVEPKTPLRFTARRIAWRPGGPLELDAQFNVADGPQLAVRLASRDGDLDLQRLAVKDAMSDATITARVSEKLLQGSFSGRLQGRSVAALLRQALPSDSGTARGDLRVTVDRARPERTQAEGRLSIEDLDLTWVLAKRVRIHAAEITAESTGLRVAKARFDWEEQPFDLRAEVWRTAAGPNIDARLESPGVVIDKLLPPEKPGEKPPAPGGPSKLWPLPLTGTVELRAAFLQYQERRVEPFEGRLSLERERARLQLTDAKMCGVSLPLVYEATPKTFAVSGKPSVRGQQLEGMARCLTGGNLDISGTADLTADLRTQGKSQQELLRNLSGSVQADVRDGRVKKFALVGNILSLRDIVSMKTMQEDGFAYRSMTAKGQFENGAFLLEEGFFDSEAARVAANGRIGLVAADTHLNVLVGLLTNVDRVVGAVPLVGDVLGGTLAALPVEVRGDIRDPLVVPLGARAVTDRLLGIFERTLKIPGKLVVQPAPADPQPAH
ncbi:MAG TPA: AsmA-like C-terminal region-containing protein [Burkholderiales bacterium]